jgi:hypothetical protein
LLLKLRAVEKSILAYKNNGTSNEDLSPVQYDDNTTVDVNQLFEKYHDYNATHPTRNKVLHIIKKENRFLHVREIARITCKLEDEISTSAVIKKISPALSILKRLPGSPLISIEIFDSHFNTFWGYRHWLTGEGQIQQGFMYNEAEIKKLQRENFFS